MLRGNIVCLSFSASGPLCYYFNVNKRRGDECSDESIDDGSDEGSDIFCDEWNEER